jgi:hypothetical protein
MLMLSLQKEWRAIHVCTWKLSSKLWFSRHIAHRKRGTDAVLLEEFRRMNGIGSAKKSMYASKAVLRV